MNIDGQNVNISLTHTNNPVQEKVHAFLKNGIAFILHDEGESFGPIFIPDRLACIHFGEVLIHSGIEQFMYSVSFQMGIYDCVSELSQKEVVNAIKHTSLCWAQHNTKPVEG